MINPFEKKILFGNAWKNYLNHINQIISKKNVNQFNNSELKKRGISQSGINRSLKKMIDMGLIEYKLTEKGFIALLS